MQSYFGEQFKRTGRMLAPAPTDVYPPEQIAAELGRGVKATIIKAHELRIPLKINSRGKSENSNQDPSPAGMDLS
jgi:hypothetical protein